MGKEFIMKTNPEAIARKKNATASCHEVVWLNTQI
jgi:hypothetical protein